MNQNIRVEHMPRLVLCTITIIAAMQITACHKQSEMSRSAPADMKASPPAVKMEIPEVSIDIPDHRESNTLAYEHALYVEIDKDLVTARIEAVRVACMADTKTSCTLLEISSDQRNGVPEGSVKVRIAPGGVDTLIKLASEDGHITHRHTSAEDLAQPIADTERQLSLLKLHRDRLTEFMNHKDIKVSDLITVSKELATVQAELESFQTQRANLKRRVDTDLLTINWSPPLGSHESARSPVLNALKEFAANFAEAIGQVISFLAFALPWTTIVVPSLVLIRWLWNWIGNWIVKRQVRGGG